MEIEEDDFSSHQDINLGPVTDNINESIYINISQENIKNVEKGKEKKSINKIKNNNIKIENNNIIINKNNLKINDNESVMNKNNLKANNKENNIITNKNNLNIENNIIINKKNLNLESNIIINKNMLNLESNIIINKKNLNLDNIFINNNKINLENNNNKKEILTPRPYQQKIFEKAKNKNSIIYLETGRGKTFISIMIMADLLSINLSSLEKQNINKNIKIIFLVCDTALIEQQKNAISSNLGLEVKAIQGKKNKKEKNDLEMFRKTWDNYNIFIAIPTILYKLLSKGFLKISEINMLIFDECHHTDSDHPYNKIMNEFYFFYKKHPNKKDFKGIKLPRIIGLTASPLKSSIKGSIESSAQKAMELLCENLDSSIIIDPDIIENDINDLKLKEENELLFEKNNFISVNSHNTCDNYNNLINIIINDCLKELLNISIKDISNKYEEYKNIGKDLNDKYSEFIYLKFLSENLSDYNVIVEEKIDLYSYRKKSQFFFILEKIQRQIYMIIDNLCLDSLIIYFNKLIQIYQNLIQNKSIPENTNLENNTQSSSLDTSDNNDDDYEIDTQSLTLEEIKKLYNIFQNTKNKLMDFKKEKNYISDKLLQMFKKIDELYKIKKDTKIIIFIGNRIVATFLSPILSKYLENNHPEKKCKEIIGINKRRTNNGTTLTTNITLNELNKTIKDFNENKFNILIGTSAVEEGLDIQSCNAVMVFVELMTAKSYIQMKGRARKHNSNFLIFTSSVEKTVKRISDFIKVGKKMREYFKDDICHDFRKKNFIKLKPEIKPNIFNNKTHAKLSLGNATQFFNEIKQQIYNNHFTLNYEIIINKEKSKLEDKLIEYEFIGHLKIKETNLNIIKTKKDREYKTKRMITKTAAERDCHFHLLTLLNEGKYLDEHYKFIKRE